MIDLSNLKDKLCFNNRYIGNCIKVFYHLYVSAKCQRHNGRPWCEDLGRSANSGPPPHQQGNRANAGEHSYIGTYF